MWVSCSFCAPGRGAGHAAQAPAVHHALKRPSLEAQDPRPCSAPGQRSQASYLAVMEARPAGGAMRKGAPAGPGEGGSIPAGGGKACACGTVCAGCGTTSGAFPRVCGRSKGWTVRAVRSARSWKGGRAWQSERAERRPRRDGGWVGGTQPRWAVEAVALPQLEAQAASLLGPFWSSPSRRIQKGPRVKLQSPGF